MKFDPLGMYYFTIRGVSFNMTGTICNSFCWEIIQFFVVLPFHEWELARVLVGKTGSDLLEFLVNP